MQGSGRVRDLWEAASQSAILKQALSEFTQGTTRADQMSKMDEVLMLWGATSDLPLMLDDSLTGKHGLISYVLDAGLNPTQLHTLERFNGRSILDSSSTSPNAPVAGIPPNGLIFFSAQSLASLKRAYAELKESVYGALVVQTRLKSYLDKIQLTVDSNNTLKMDFSALNQEIESKKGVDAVSAVMDLIELNKYAGVNLYKMGWDGLDRLKASVDQYPGNASIQTILEETGVKLTTAGSFIGTDQSEIILAGNSAEDLLGNDGNDSLYAGTGNDNLWGGEGHDVLDAGKGDDRLWGGAGNDFLKGGEGNDLLSGESGGDTYYIGQNSGIDTINNYDSDASGSNIDTLQFGEGITASEVSLSRLADDLLICSGVNDVVTVQSYFQQDGATNYALEKIKFADGTTWDITALKAKMLVSTIADDTMYGYATADIISGGTGSDKLTGGAGADTLLGGEGDDELWGGVGEDWLQGDYGNDRLYGDEGDDVLYGLYGNDTLNGNAGNDTLDGGVGNDTLNGGAGADTYLFGKSSGRDRLDNYDSDALGIQADTVKLGAGITSSDVLLQRKNDDLVIALKGTEDSLTIGGYFTADASLAYSVESIQFADGVVWNIATVKSLLLLGAGTNDSLVGYSSADTLNGGEGTDTLQGLAHPITHNSNWFNL
jgi:Ca2+-binding RTX toxin-like protein